jgi:TRAP-type mannitol/chloroaromatic compound transport system permease small subunit
VQGLLRVSKIIDTITGQIGKLTLWLVILMLAIGFYNVIARTLGGWLNRNLASNVFLEAQWYLFSLVFFFGFAYILQRNENVRVDFLYSNWSTRRRAIVNLLGTIFFLIPFCIVGILVTLDPVRLSVQLREMSPDPGGLPRYPLKAMIIVAFSLLLLQGISELIKHTAILTGATPVDVQEQIEEYHQPAVE